MVYLSRIVCSLCAQLAPTDPTVHYNIAAAYAAQGKLTESLRHAQVEPTHASGGG
jgi:hypothetical protein